MGDFARLGNEKYPKKDFDGDEDQSYGFVDAFKLQTGNLRGTQGVGYGSVKIDGANDRISVGSDSINVILGDQSETNTSFGIGFSDDTSPRFLAGKYPDGSVKMKLSQTGYDVNTATDDQLVWSSDFNMFKIAATASLSIPSLAAPVFPTLFTQATTSVDTGIISNTALAHSGYIIGSAGYSYQLPYTATAADAGGSYGGILYRYDAYTRIVNGTVEFSVTATNYDAAGALAATIVKYYIFKETATA